MDDDLCIGTGAGPEVIEANGVTLAYLICATLRPSASHFATPPECEQQVGLMVYGPGEVVAPHVHVSDERQEHGTPGTSEVLVVRDGRCRIDIYDDGRRLIASRELATGDCAVLVAGGHGVQMLEATSLLLIRPGPFRGPEQKQRFQPEEPA